MIVPVIHLNGTSREALIADLKHAYVALMEAKQALKRTAPHGRDYYTLDPDAFNTAVEEHWDRVDRVDGVRQEIEDLAIAIDQA